LAEAGVKVWTVLDYRDVLFGGHAPEPDDHLLDDLRDKMRATGAQIGIATDGDADRFGIGGWGRNFPAAELRDCPAIRLSGREPGMEQWRGQVGATTNLINAIAKARAGGALRDAGGFQIHW
jgi:hypothetical protein